MQAATAGTVYFAVVFAAGFVLGVVRNGWLAPAIGAVPAVLTELPLILGVAWLACARILRGRSFGAAQAGLMGAVAFALLMAAEVGVSTGVAGRTLAGHLALYREPAHLLGLAGQLAFAALPWVQVRRAPASGP
jgi:hypothetical protein